MTVAKFDILFYPPTLHWPDICWNANTTSLNQSQEQQQQQQRSHAQRSCKDRGMSEKHYERVMVDCLCQFPQVDN